MKISQMMNQQWTLACWLLVSLGLCVGCQPPAADSLPAGAADTEDAAHDHAEDFPQNFSGAVGALDKMYQAIDTAVSAGKPEDAHHELHEVDHVLQHLIEFAQDAGISGDGLTAAKASVQTLVDGFGKLDAALHSGEEPDSEGLPESMPAAMEQLKQAAAAL